MSQANRGRVFLPSRHMSSGIFVSRGSQSSLKVAKSSWCFRTVSVAKRSVAVGIVSEPEICHGCRNFYCLQCAYPGAALIPDLSWQQEPLRKNRDKQLTFIVRVRCSGC